MATQIRGKDGNFVPKTKLNVVRHHVRTKKLLLPFIALVAIVGAVVIYTSHASSYVACNKIAGVYKFDEACVTSSDEASVVRMYYATLNRAPDKTGLEYWLTKIRNKSATFTKMADQFMASNEFKNKYGSLSNAAFVKAMYPQVFERQPDASGAAYWTKKLDAKSLTRAQMIVNFVQSPEMKRSFSTRVALALNIPPSEFTKDTTTFSTTNVTCLGSVTTSSDGKKWCTIKLNTTSSQVDTAVASIPISGISTLSKPGQYVFCATSKSANVQRDTTIVDGQPKSFLRAGIVSYAGSILGASPIQRSFLSGGLYTDYSAGFSTWNPGTDCQEIGLLPGSVDSLTLTASSRNQPADATYSFELATTSLSKKAIETDVSFVESFDSNQKTVFTSGCGTPPDEICSTMSVSINGRIKKVLREDYHWVDATPASVKPNWIHQTGYIQGKNTINFNLQTLLSTPSGVYGDSKAQIKVTDAATGQPITGYKVVKLDTVIGTDWIYKSLTPENFVLSSVGGSNLYVELNLSKPTNVKVELIVLDGKVRVYSSSIGYGWPEEQN
jgi:hypothetical protein